MVPGLNAVAVADVFVDGSTRGEPHLDGKKFQITKGGRPPRGRSAVGGGSGKVVAFAGAAQPFVRLEGARMRDPGADCRAVRACLPEPP